MNEKALLSELLDIECQLSPENLTWDGERPRDEVNRAHARLMKERAEVIRKLGREPSSKEIYGF